jgi:hypothetical protein
MIALPSFMNCAEADPIAGGVVRGSAAAVVKV